MDLLSIAPELLVILTVLTVILIDAFSDKENKAGFLAFVSGTGFTVALGVLLGLYLGGYRFLERFSGTFLPDNMSLLFRCALLISAILTVLLSVEYVQRSLKHPGEFFSLVGMATLGALFLSAATEMLTLYLSLELLSISSFVLVGLRKQSARSAEASIKYLIFGAISSGLLLYGFSLIFGMTGSLHFSQIHTYLQDNTASLYLYRSTAEMNYGFQDGHLKLELMAALIMIIAGLSYKIAAVPFHMWAPDVYEGAPLPVTAFLSSSSKLAGFAILLRVLEAVSTADTVPLWSRLIALLAFASMTYGNVVAIAQHNVKRLFAYSSIAHAGYLLMGVLAFSELRSRETALIGLLFYLLVYVFMNLGAFSVIIYFTGQVRSARLQDWSGLGRRSPWYGFVLACCLLSLTGLPPFAGFTGKFYLFGAVTEMGPSYLWLVAAAVLNSVISLYYYARIIRVLFFGAPDIGDEAQAAHPALALASAISLVGILALFLFPSWLIDFVARIHTLI